MTNEERTQKDIEYFQLAAQASFLALELVTHLIDGLQKDSKLPTNVKAELARLTKDFEAGELRGARGPLERMRRVEKTYSPNEHEAKRKRPD